MDGSSNFYSILHLSGFLRSISFFPRHFILWPIFQLPPSNTLNELSLLLQPDWLLQIDASFSVWNGRSDMSKRFLRGVWSGIGTAWIRDPSRPSFHVWDTSQNKWCSSQSYPKKRCSTILPQAVRFECKHQEVVQYCVFQELHNVLVKFSQVIIKKSLSLHGHLKFK